MSDAEFWGLTLHLYRLREQRYGEVQAVLDGRAWETAVTIAKLMAGKSVTASDEFTWLGQEQDDSPEMTFEEAAGFFSQLQQVAAATNGERT